MMKQRMENRARLTRLATPQVERYTGTWLLTRPSDAPKWPADEWERLDRYLIFGDERDMQVVRARIEFDGPRVVRRVVELSTMDRVVSNEPCLIVLAMSFSLGNRATRAMAREAAPEVARTRDELRRLEQYVNAMPGTVRNATPGIHRGSERGAVVPSGAIAPHPRLMPNAALVERIIRRGWPPALAAPDAFRAGGDY